MRRLIAISLAISLSACGTIGTLASSPEQFKTTETMQLTRAPAHFVDGVIRAGTSLGYKYTGGNREKNQVILLNNSGFASEILIGKIQKVQVQVSLGSDNRTVTFDLETYGNFSTSKQDRIERRLSDLKTAITNNID